MQHAGIDIQAMYPAGKPPAADDWTWDNFLIAAEKCFKANCAFGLPLGGDVVDAELTVRSGPAGDRWTRRFGRRRWTTECSPTPAGFVEWLGPGRLRGLIGLDLVVAHPAPERATLRLRGLRLGPLRTPRPPGLRVDVTVDRAGRLLSVITVVTVAGRLVLGYEGWIR